MGTFERRAGRGSSLFVTTRVRLSHAHSQTLSPRAPGPRSRSTPPWMGGPAAVGDARSWPGAGLVGRACASGIREAIRRPIRPRLPSTSSQYTTNTDAATDAMRHLITYFRDFWHKIPAGTGPVAARCDPSRRRQTRPAANLLSYKFAQAQDQVKGHSHPDHEQHIKCIRNSHYKKSTRNLHQNNRIKGHLNNKTRESAQQPK